MSDEAGSGHANAGSTSQPAHDGLRRTPLEAEHRALGAKMGAFAGWLMPISYPSGTVAEHTAVRTAVGAFDVTHLGKFTASGPGALPALQRAFTNDVSKVPVGGAQYGMALNERGGIEDDLIVYRLAEDRYLVVPNAANVERVYRAFTAQVGGGGDGDGDVESGVLHDWALIAVQGPASPAAVGGLFAEAPSLGYFRCAESTWKEGPAVVSRTGYTGEHGFELFVPYGEAVSLWRAVLGAEPPVAPAGLAARDTLRTEMGYPLHGNDISAARTPLEAGLGWAVSFTKGDFVGRDALVAQREGSVPSKLWGLLMQDRLIPRPHYDVIRNGSRVGETTSGTFSPTLQRGIAMAYLSPSDGFSPGDNVEIDIRGRRGVAAVIKPPFVDASPK
jgi:aminomethyltransferase